MVQLVLLVLLVQGFKLVEGFNSSRVQLVQRFNWFKGSMGARIQLVQGFNSLRVQLVQGFNWGKGLVSSRLQLIQGFN